MKVLMQGKQGREKGRENSTRLLVLATVLTLALALCSIALAEVPSFIGITENQLFTAPEDSAFELYVHATDPEDEAPYVISYSESSNNPKNLTTFNMATLNDTAALINFTPNNDNVLENGTAYIFFLIVEDNASERNTTRIYINVTNTNDPPNISEFAPSNLNVSMLENNTAGFLFNASSSDPDVPYGDIINATWFYDSTVQTNDDSFNLTTDFCAAGIHNVTLIVNDTAGLTDVVEWNLTVNNTNRLPAYNESTPIQNYTWSEDSNNTNLFNATDYFYDFDYLECGDTNKDNITFITTGNINIEIIVENDTFNVSFYVQDNWFGTEEVTFYINDTYNTTNSTNVVVLNVTNINDAPVLADPGNQTAWANARFNLLLNGSDEDIYIDATIDTLEYGENISGVLSVFSLNTSSGLINFTPQDSDTGEYFINLTVNDTSAETDWVVINLTIYANKVPYILSVANESTDENSFYQVIVHGVDEENHTLNITSNFTSWSGTALNSSAFNFSFTPNDADVGVHDILLTVADMPGSTNTSMMQLTVTDQNNAPVLATIADQVVRAGKNFSLLVTATDGDSDDMTFRDNATLFNISTFDPSGGIGYINFTTATEDIGNHSINITVNDTVGAEDSQIFNLEIVPNRKPAIDPIATPQNATTYIIFGLLVTASDPDDDELNFTSNFTAFTVDHLNTTAANFTYTFSSSETGLINITIIVNDSSDARANTSFILNITHVNNAPAFIGGTENRTFVENVSELFVVAASDADNETLTFSTNTSAFNITAINDTAANFTFNPHVYGTGTITVIFNVTDGYEWAEEYLNFTTITNTAPDFNYTLPSNTTLEINENQSIDFNITATDTDGHNFTYLWQFALRNETTRGWCAEYDGTSIATCQENNRSIACEWDGSSSCVVNESTLSFETHATTNNYTFAPNFTQAGNYSVWILLNDSYNGNASFYWNLSVRDQNMAPRFGIMEHVTYDDFSGGVINFTNISTDGLVSLGLESAYSSSGTYRSASIDIGPDTYFLFGNITWTAHQPAGTNITLATRTSTASGSGFGDYSGIYHESPANITSLPREYLQYRAIFRTDDTSFGPNLTSVQVGYSIANLEIAGPAFWIDLDDFFSDPDGDDALAYSVTGNSSITVAIGSGNAITLTPASGFTGSETMIFNASDGVAFAESNPVKITVTESESTSTATVSGGGGGGSTSITITKKVETNTTQNVTELLSIELVSPGLVTIYENSSMTVPVILENSGEQPLVGITLGVQSAVEELELSLGQRSFAMLAPGERRETTLTITPYQVYGTYEVTVTATVDEPPFEDTATFFINSLAMGEHNASQINTRIDFARDLFTNNAICLELNELVDHAAAALESGDMQNALSLVNQAIEGCSYLISESRGLLEPSRERNILGAAIGLISRYRWLGIVLLGAISAAFIIVAYVMRKARRQGRRRRRSEKTEGRE